MPDLIPAPLTKYYEAAIQDGPCGAGEAIALITTSRVDRDGEVMVPTGAELTNYRRNPILMWGHAKGLPSEGEVGMPIGVNLWIKPSRDGDALIAKHAFDMDDSFSLRVGGKVKRGVLRTYSITFQPIEFGPPTREEIRKNPSWANAKTIFRKWELIEYSVVAMPANVDAVTLVKRKKTMPEIETEVAAETETGTGDDEPEAVVVNAAALAPDANLEVVIETKAAALADDDEEEEEEDEEEEDDTFKRGDHVKCNAPHCKGHGMVASIHKSGMVPDVAEDVFGTRDQPAAKVRMYKAVDGGHVPSSVYKGIMCKHMSKCDALKPPVKRKAGEPEYKQVEPKWTAAERAAYLQSKQESPEFLALVERRMVDLFETRVLGKP